VREYRSAAGALRVLDGADLVLNRGELVGLVGPSGSGKSTLLHTAGLLEKAEGGQVLLEGEDCMALNEAGRTRMRRQKLGFVYQFHHLLPEFTALENVAMPLLIRRMETSQAYEKARVELEKVGLGHRLEHMPSELSGGERQRAAVARALVTAPKCILADEPTGNLDRASAEGVFDLLKALNVSDQLSLVIVTHDMTLAKQMDRCYRLVDGQLQAVS